MAGKLRLQAGVGGGEKALSFYPESSEGASALAPQRESAADPKVWAALQFHRGWAMVNEKGLSPLANGFAGIAVSVLELRSSTKPPMVPSL
jgi:hypothetical protein